MMKLSYIQKNLYLDLDSNFYYARYQLDFKQKLVKLSKDKETSIIKLSNIIHNLYSSDTPSMTFDNLFNEFITVITPLQSEQEIKTKLSRYEVHIKKHLSKKRINDIKYKDCQKIINISLHNGLAPKTAKNIKALLQATFNYAIKNEYIDKNPASLVDIPAFDNKIDMTLTDDDIKSLISQIFKIQDPAYKLMFIFALHGRRLSEILTMQWYQVDLINKAYSIPAQKNKAKKNQSHAMTDVLFNHLLKHKELISFNSSHNYLFTNPTTKKPYKDIRKFFISLKKKANITKPFRFHDFRHLVGTLANNKNVSMEDISKTLGHSDIVVTQKYITPKKDTSKKVIDIIYREHEFT